MSQTAHPPLLRKRRWGLVVLGAFAMLAALTGMITGKAHVRSEEVEGPNVRIASALTFLVGFIAVRGGLKKKEPIQPPETTRGK